MLEEREIERLGSPRTIPVDTRIIAATHRNLEQRIADGTFREDLYYRLNVFPIVVPPLRDRGEDVTLLAWRFVTELSTPLGRRIDAIEEESLAAMRQYPWPGNVRELRNVVERAMITARGPRLTVTVPAAGGRRAGAKRQADRCRTRSHPWRPREHGLAHSRCRRRGRSPGPPPDDARDADGETGPDAAAAGVADSRSPRRTLVRIPLRVRARHSGRLTTRSLPEIARDPGAASFPT